MRRRAARPAATGVDEDSLDLLSLGTLGPGISPADPDTALDVQAALRALGPEQRAALVLVDMLGYPVADAAQILGISPGTVKSRCARGRARLLPRLAHLRGGTDGPDGPMAAAQPLADQADRSLREPSGGNQPVPPRVLPAEGGGESRP
jgi:RNA polymerase sigma-70 factor (ECF subfamily)